jgi:hypothetical protein
MHSLSICRQQAMQRIGSAERECNGSWDWKFICDRADMNGSTGTHGPWYFWPPDRAGELIKECRKQRKIIPPDLLVRYVSI